MSLQEKIDRNRVPQHVAIIMDGNGRWAKKVGELRTFGHHNGVSSVKETVEAAVNIGVKHLTIYAFSTENWNRPIEEVNTLMEILIKSLEYELPTMNKNGVRLNNLGDESTLPISCIESLNKAKEATKNNTELTLNIALNYSGKWDITNAAKNIALAVKEGTLNVSEINEDIFSQHLSTVGIPDPELMIRTSGEMRISNYLLWQLAYAELYFTPKLWPDFRTEDFYEAIVEYQQRERRFGLTGDQIKNQ